MHDRPAGGLDAITGQLVDAWRTLGRWTALPWDERPGHRAWNRLVEQTARLEERVLADVAGPTVLARIAEDEAEPFVRDQARRALDPGVPDDERSRERWARHPVVRLTGVDLLWRPGLLLSPDDSTEPLGNVGSSPDRSHLLGSPAGPLKEWPRRADGVPLVLILEADLSALASFGDLGTSALLGLPPRGRLQVFHDLETWGWRPDDGATGAWLVRYVPIPLAEAEPPDDLEEDRRRSSRPVRLLPFPSVAGKAEPATPSAAEALERAQRRLAEAVHRQAAQHGQHQAGSTAGPPSDAELDRDPGRGRFAQLLGLPPLPVAEAMTILSTARPEVDRWQLLGAVPGVNAFEGLLGDLAYLEIWGPAAHLADGRLETVWCLMRS